MPSTGWQGRQPRENSKATFREYSAANDIGSAPANNWSSSASGIRGDLRRAIVILLGIHYGRPNTKFPTVPIHLPLGCVHRMVNPGKIPLEIVEVQIGSYTGEDDIVRIEDVYGR